MLQIFARWLIRIGGWTSVGELPNIDKAVCIVAPHTTNWDGFWLLLYKTAVAADVRFLAKETLFWWPLGPLIRKLGAMPIDRRNAMMIVPRIVTAFENENRLWLALTPEGTRRWVPHWKTGFYRIAEAANVPIILVFIDYEKRQMGIGKTLPRGLSIDDVLLELREFYAPIKGHRSESQGPIAFPPD